MPESPAPRKVGGNQAIQLCVFNAALERSGCTVTLSGRQGAVGMFVLLVDGGKRYSIMIMVGALGSGA